MNKLGCIAPSVVQLPWDLHALLPPDVQANVVTLNVRNGLPGELERANGQLQRASDVLIDEGASCIVVQGLPNAAARGFDGDRAMLRGLTRERGAVPIVSSLDASFEALRALGSRRPLLVTQYSDQVNELIVAYGRASGVESPVAVGLGATNAAQVNALTAQDFISLARRSLAAHARADAVFLCARGNLLARSLELEAALDLPVIEQMQATVWWSLRRIGVAPAPGFGRLLTSTSRP